MQLHVINTTCLIIICECRNEIYTMKAGNLSINRNSNLFYRYSRKAIKLSLILSRKAVTWSKKQSNQSKLIIAQMKSILWMRVIYFYMPEQTGYNKEKL